MLRWSNHLSNQGSFYEMCNRDFCILRLIETHTHTHTDANRHEERSREADGEVERKKKHKALHFIRSTVIVQVALLKEWLSFLCQCAVCIHAQDFQLYLYLLLISVNYKTLCNMIHTTIEHSLQIASASFTCTHVFVARPCVCFFSISSLISILACLYIYIYLVCDDKNQAKSENRNGMQNGERVWRSMRDGQCDNNVTKST